MAKMIAYCGLDCQKCEAYIATQKKDQDALKKIAAKWTKQFGEKTGPKDVICDGCTTTDGRKIPHCSVCEIRICCVGKNQENCALCGEYICDKLAKFFKDAPQAKENLDKIKNKA